MSNENTFGVHFALRSNKKDQYGRYAVYARISANRTRCELALKEYLPLDDWNSGKGMAKPKTLVLKRFNAYLEEVRGKLARHYRELQMQDETLTALSIKSSFLGVGKEKYLKAFLLQHFKSVDIPLKQLNYEFITQFEFFIRTTPLKESDPCTNNGTMKHLERLRKMVTWAVKNEWILKDAFINFKLKFKKSERDFLNEQELSTLEGKSLENPILGKVRDLFVFSCYTGLSYIDLIELQEQHILSENDGFRWIRTFRAKTETPVNVPLLQQAEAILQKFTKSDKTVKTGTIFPKITNQEINRDLKIIAEILEIRKYLTFHLARHTFATTVTLMNGVPIETISKMLGHTKLSTTMIYARVSQTKIGMDMNLLQKKFSK